MYEAVSVFFAIVILLLAMEVVMNDLSDSANFFGFAFGFAMGTYVGHITEERQSIGMATMRIVTIEESNDEITRFLESE